MYNFLLNFIFLSNVLHASLFDNKFLTFVSTGLFYSVDFSAPLAYRTFKSISLINNLLMSFKSANNLKLLTGGFLFALALETSNLEPVLDYIVTSVAMHVSLL